MEIVPFLSFIIRSELQVSPIYHWKVVVPFQSFVFDFFPFVKKKSNGFFVAVFPSIPILFTYFPWKGRPCYSEDMFWIIDTYSNKSTRNTLLHLIVERKGGEEITIETMENLVEFQNNFNMFHWLFHRCQFLVFGASTTQCAPIAYNFSSSILKFFAITEVCRYELAHMLDATRTSSMHPDGTHS